MNYLLTEEMSEYRDEMEQMLFKLPIAGSAFKKVYYDPLMESPVLCLFHQRILLYLMEHQI